MDRVTDTEMAETRYGSGGQHTSEDGGRIVDRMLRDCIAVFHAPTYLSPSLPFESRSALWRIYWNLPQENMDIGGHNRSYGLKATEIEEALPTGKAQSGLARATREILLRKGLVLLCALAGFALGLLVAFTTKPSYTAKAVFLPPGSPSSNSAVLIGQLGQLAGLAGSSGSLLGGFKDPGAVYVGILQSRT